MEQEHRTKILSNIDRLVSQTNYDLLVAACLEEQLLYKAMVDKIQSDSTTQEERHRDLLKKITHRGPRAFDIFTRILERHFPDASEILTHVSYLTSRTLDPNDNVPSIRELRNRNKPANQATANPGIINNNVNHNHNNNNNNNNVHPVPSTSRSISPRSISPRIQQISQQLLNHSIARRIPQIVEFKEQVNPELRVQVERSTKFHGENTSKVAVYPMRSEKRGLLIVVNNIHFRNAARRRNGAETDRDNLVNVFRQMGFFICVQEDLTKLEFLDFLKNIVHSKEIRAYDCFVFAVFSHGEHNEVEFVDGGRMEVEDILTKFNNFNCQSLVGKPKIFLFPFCRGPLSDHGVTRRAAEPQYAVNVAHGSNHPTYYDMKICYSTISGCNSFRDPIEGSWAEISETEVTQNRIESDSSGSNVEGSNGDGANVATFYDMKICYSTVSGYNAFRDPVEGSWYVQILCKVLAEHAHDTHLEDLLKIIGEHMNFKRTERDHLQTASNEDRGFNKNLFFNPGYYG